MGLQVGVISPIQYLDGPGDEVEEFIWYLDFKPEESGWHAVSDTETFVEYTRETLARHVEEYAAREQVGDDEAATVRAWVDSLPWRDDGQIMLHFAW